jgi:hypothetical protein
MNVTVALSEVASLHPRLLRSAAGTPRDLRHGQGAAEAHLHFGHRQDGCAEQA